MRLTKKEMERRSEDIEDEDFDTIFENDEFILGDYNILIIGGRIYAKIFRHFGSASLDFIVARVNMKVGELPLPLNARVTKDGVLINVEGEACDVIGEHIRQAEPLQEKEKKAETAEPKQESGYIETPAAEEWDILCHAGKTPIYTHIVEKIEKLYKDAIGRGEKPPRISEIGNLIHEAYNGEITRTTATSHSYKYTTVVLERLKEEIPMEKLIRKTEKIRIFHPDWTPIAMINKVTIFDKVLERIERLYEEKDMEPPPESVAAVIDEMYDHTLNPGTLIQYAACYRHRIREETKEIPVERRKPSCKFCGSRNVEKHGTRRIKGGIAQQRYKCVDCKRRFSDGLYEPEEAITSTIYYEPKRLNLTKIGSIDQRVIYKEVVDEIVKELGTGEPKRTITQIIEELHCVEPLTASNYATAYRKWIDEHGLLSGTVLEGAKLFKRPKHPGLKLICSYHNTPIYDKILLEIIRANDQKISDIKNTIERKYKEGGEKLKNTTITKYAYDYQAFIYSLSGAEIKKIYAKLPADFNIQNIKAHIPMRFSQTEIRTRVAKLAVAMLLGMFNCEEVTDGVFHKTSE